MESCGPIAQRPKRRLTTAPQLAKLPHSRATATISPVRLSTPDGFVQVQQRISAGMARCEDKAANQISLFPEEMKEKPFEDGGFL
jgi:hypothetical protein